MVTIQWDHPLYQAYQRVREEYRAAEATLAARPADDMAALGRYYAAKQSLDYLIKALKAEVEAPIRPDFVLPWLRSAPPEAEA